MLLGHIDLVDRHTVRGWAADTDRPYGTLEVAVFVDGKLAGLTRADQARDDLKDPAVLGAGVHGVAYQFDPPLAAQQDHDVVVRFAEGGKLLGQWRVTREFNGTPVRGVAPGEAPLDATQADRRLRRPKARRIAPALPVASAGRFPHAGSGALPDDALIGFVDSCTLAGVEGWAASETNPDEVLDISIFVDDRKVAQIRSEVPREDKRAPASAEAHPPSTALGVSRSSAFPSTKLVNPLVKGRASSRIADRDARWLILRQWRVENMGKTPGAVAVDAGLRQVLARHLRPDLRHLGDHLRRSKYPTPRQDLSPCGPSLHAGQSA